MLNINLIVKNKGFTLIELLVVFSVISMLSTIVLAGLANARVKANNSRIIQNAQQLRNQIEIGRGTDGRYPNLMGSSQSGGYVIARQSDLSSNTKFRPILDDIMRISGTTFPAGYGGGYSAGGPCGEVYTLPINDNNSKMRIFLDPESCFNGGGGPSVPASRYSIYVLMMPANSGYFCIDSAGKTSRPTSGYLPSAPVLPTC